MDNTDNRECDREYWSRYYVTNGRAPPSSFARWCVETGRVAFADAVVDAGCGEGRDGSFFASIGAQVVAVDAAENAVRQVRQRGLRGVCASMAWLPGPSELFDAGPRTRVVVYSRFSLHALRRDEADAFLGWCAEHAGVVLIETRSVNDPRYGVGDAADADAFVDTHYRRFTRLSDLTAQLARLGLRVEHAEENWHAAHAAGDHAVVNRIVATRQ